MGLSNYSSTNRSKRNSNLETNIVDDKQTQKTTHNRSENQPKEAINGRRNTRNSLSRSLLIETVDNNTNTKKLTRQISLRESKLPTSPPKTRTRGRPKQPTANIDEAQKDAPKEKKTGRNRTASDQETTNTQRLIKRRVTLGPSEIKAIREKSIAKTTPSTNKTAPNKAVKSDKQEVESTTSTIESVKDRPNHHQTHHVGANNVTEEAKEVRVPGFRITAPIRPGYRLEGTEDTTDDCYLKRHQKYEAEEIRIKRWDMRRQKEEFERNKLLKGRYYSKSNISASNSKTSKSSASSSSSSAPPSADPSNSSLAASDFKPVLGPYGIYYKKFDPLQIDEIHSIQVIQFDPKSIPQPQPEPASSVTAPKPTETEVEPEQQTNKKPHHGKKNQHQSTTTETNTQQPSATSPNRASLPSQSPQTQPEAPVRRKRARVSSSASYQQENKVSNENTSENLHRPSKPTLKHSTGQKSARGPLNSVTNHLPVRVFETVSNHSVYDDLDLDYMSSSTNSIDDSFSIRMKSLNSQMKRKSLPTSISTNRIVLTGKSSMPRKRARLT